MNDRAADSPALTRGFLFCDLRDYTAFVEAHGDQAAAELLGDYRAIVRDALGATGGGEIRTEGDSFYIVFSSVGAAVRCGLAIVAEAARASAARADRPIRVGVGVHAGESVAEGEGFVGSAVNIAARICAVAAPGEVLVSDTVRSLVRTSLPLTFRSRGRPKLKGIAEPIELFAVTPAVETTAVRQAPAARPSRRRLIVVGLGALIVIALAGPLGASVLLRPSEAGNPSPSPAGSAGSSAAAGASPASASAVDLASLPGRIAFISYQLEPGAFLPRRQIRVAGPGGGDAALVSDLLSDASNLRASTDRHRVAYTADFDLLTSKLDGSKAEPWPGSWRDHDFGGSNRVGYGAPFILDTWFSDGDVLVQETDGATHWTLSADGEHVETTSIPGSEAAASPLDDDVIAVTKTGADGSSIWVVSRSNVLNAIRLTTGLLASQPAWSPDALSIAFSGREVGKHDGIWTVSSNGSGANRITDGAIDKHPSWSPDGHWIVFDRTTDGVRRLWVVRPDGTDLTELPIGAEGEQIDSPVWLVDVS